MRGGKGGEEVRERRGKTVRERTWRNGALPYFFSSHILDWTKSSFGFFQMLQTNFLVNPIILESCPFKIYLSTFGSNYNFHIKIINIRLILVPDILARVHNVSGSAWPEEFRTVFSESFSQSRILVVCLPDSGALIGSLSQCTFVVLRQADFLLSVSIAFL